MENNVPNLDAQTSEDLWAFWTKHDRPTRKAAATIFPDRPAGYVKATARLACYASNKATAQRLRAKGEIATAKQYEDICEMIYSKMLPEWARW